MKLPVQLSQTNINVFFSKMDSRKVKHVWGLLPVERGRIYGRIVGG
jgi:hypothetical protein